MEWQRSRSLDRPVWSPRCRTAEADALVLRRQVEGLLPAAIEEALEAAIVARATAGGLTSASALYEDLPGPALLKSSAFQRLRAQGVIGEDLRPNALALTRWIVEHQLVLSAAGITALDLETVNLVRLDREVSYQRERQERDRQNVAAGRHVERQAWDRRSEIAERSHEGLGRG